MRDGGFDLENPREHWMDGILEMNAPFYGEVVTLYEPLAGYRLYDGNATFRHTIESARFAYAFRNESSRLDYFARRCQSWGLAFDPAVARNRSIFLLEYRLAADKLASVKDPSGEPMWRTVSRGLKACIDAHLPISNRIIRGVWFVVVAISPRPVARRLFTLRYIVAKRPAWIEPLLAIIVNISGWRGPLRTSRPNL
jgi:hypothetical protein